MNKKIGVIILVVLLVLLGGGAYVMMNKSSKTPTAEGTPTASPTETTAQAALTQGTLKSLMGLAKPQTCTFTSSDATTTGTVFVTDGKMAGDFTTTKEGNTVTAHMVVSDGYSYLWTGMTKVGFKVSLAEAQKAEATSTNNQGVGLNENVSYSCKDWSVDASKFTIPTDIKFSTFTMPQKAAPQTGSGVSGSGAAVGCSACDSLPEGAAQTACKTQLHCQ